MTGGSNFNVNRCTEAVRRYIFKTYVYSSLYCFSCHDNIDQRIKTAYRFALLMFFGNIPHINVRNINKITTHTSTLTVNANVLSMGELQQKQCF